MDNVLFVRTELVLGILTLILGVPASRRVLVAWMVWLTLRWEWRDAKPSVHRWLWIRTLRHADGKPDRRA